ncbi:3-hydroxyacyl-CoA dehydratase 1 [Actinidia rufa]|uniref:3-hydroxyacyl-CoA dehydratase 1 n=1 Tax=Actinidia rufa TaxID=165716 RepID=A0A7J0GIV9_9ERIC|nr:3-hydroxyacyl-CoA dehydratase 1 [Actinidia rufa]
MVDLFKPALADLISLRMPTIAVVTGHAAATGMMLAMSHDYMLTRSDRGVLSKVVLSTTRRDVMLRAKKVTAAKAVVMGIVDSVHDSAEAVVETAVRLEEELVKRKWDGEACEEIRKALYPELCGDLGLADKSI